MLMFWAPCLEESNWDPFQRFSLAEPGKGPVGTTSVTSELSERYSATSKAPGGRLGERRETRLLGILMAETMRFDVQCSIVQLDRSSLQITSRGHQVVGEVNSFLRAIVLIILSSPAMPIGTK